MQSSSYIHFQHIKKIIIPRDVNDTYLSHYYENLNVTFFNLDFNYFSNSVFRELEHPELITDWTSNTKKYADKVH